jgi:hypothetical protein
MAQLPGLHIDWVDFIAKVEAMERIGYTPHALLVAQLRRDRRKQERLTNDARREAGIRKARMS